MRTRVKDMSRRQQKAVFASKGSSSSSARGSDRDKILEKEFPKKKSFIQKFKGSLKKIKQNQKRWDLAHDDYLASVIKHSQMPKRTFTLRYTLPVKARKELQAKFKKKYPKVAKDTIRPNAFPSSFMTSDVKFWPKAKKAYKEVFDIEVP